MPLKRKPNFEGKIRAIQEGLEYAIGDLCNEAAKNFRETQSTWENSGDKSSFTVEVAKTGSKVGGKVVHDGEPAVDASITVWQLLEGGTKVRFMEVSEDWSSKTTPYNLSSSQGHGETLGLGPIGWPGIEERNWIVAVRDKMLGKERGTILDAVVEAMNAR